MKRIISVSAIVAALMLGSLSLEAKSIQEDNQALNHEIDLQKKSFKIASSDIIQGLHETLIAINALEKKEIDRAKKALQKATKSFEAALKIDPKLELVPVENSIELYSLDASPKEIDKALKSAIKLLEAHEVQTAKEILQPLKDEMYVETVYIPMALYPISTKTALDALNKGDEKTALIALVDGLDTLVKRTVVIPIGLLAAQDLTIVASKLDKSKKEEALALITSAENELQKAYVLGYVGKYTKEYKILKGHIDEIKKEIKGENKVVKLYEKLKNSFTSLLHKTRTTYYKDSVAKEEAKALKNPSHIKGGAAAKAEVEEIELKEQFKAKQQMEAFKKESKEDEAKTIEH